MRKKVFISYSHRDSRWLSILKDYLSLLEDKYPIDFWDDSHIDAGIRWRDEIENALEQARVAVLLVSSNFLASDFIKSKELPFLLQSAEHDGLPILWIAVTHSLFAETEIKDYQCLNDPFKPLEDLKTAERNKVLVEVCQNIKKAALKFVPPKDKTPVPPAQWESAGGVMPLDSPFYVERSYDEEFYQRLASRDGIIRLKGLRQVGKTSLLSRGMALAKEGGATVVNTDFERFKPEELKSLDSLTKALALRLSADLEAKIPVDDIWSSKVGAKDNFETFVKAALKQDKSDWFVWVLDEVGYILPCEFADQFFSLLRTWFNSRSIFPESLGKLSLVLSYATEPNFFIKTYKDESPFNVGSRWVLGDFTLDEVEYINYLYGTPVSDRAELEEFRLFVSGHPFLVRRGLHAMARESRKSGRATGFRGLKSGNYLGEEPFGDHLKHILGLLERDVELRKAVADMLNKKPLSDSLTFHRLRSGGIIAGEAPVNARIRCNLYSEYLDLHLNGLDRRQRL